MSGVRLFLGAVWVGFCAMTARALAEQGYLGFLDTATANAATGVLFLDLVVCLGLACLWMLRDARRLGIAAWPFVALSAAFGAAGPLLYLIRRPRDVALEAGEPGPRGLMRRVVVIATLVASIAATLYALDRHGAVAVLLYASASSAGQLLFVDLVICLAMVAGWTIRDARARGAAALPFLPSAPVLGPAAPLLYLATRGAGRAWQWLAGLGAIVLAAVALTLGSGHADLRSEAVRRPAGDSERRARELLGALAARHGLTAWDSHTTMEVIASDAWPGGGPWWPAPVQRFRAQRLLGTFTSRVELLDGRGRGELWGLQAWAPYKQAAGNREPRFLAEDRAISFYLPTLQYFDELPFRLLAAPVVRDAGPARHRGRVYDRVFVTWGGPEPRPEFDQYVLWIDRETGLLSMARYTLRDGLAWLPPLQARLFRSVMLGTIHFDDYREVQGVTVPFVQTVVLPPPELTRYPLARHFFHRLEVEEVRFDSVPRAALLPDPSRGMSADRKPASQGPND